MVVNYWNISIVELLLKCGCNIYVINKRNEIVFIKVVFVKCECIYGCWRCVWKYYIVLLLVEKGCDVRIRDIDGNNVFYWLLVFIIDLIIVRLLFRNGVDVWE